jgi:uncharacterized RDD family membrane protein YckC
MDQNLASLKTRVLARIVDSIIFLFVSFFISLCSFFVFTLVSSQSLQDINTYQQEVNLLFIESLTQDPNTSNLNREKIRNCDLQNLDKDICNQITQQINFENVVSLTVVFFLSTTYFTLLPLTKLQGTFGKKLFKIKIVSLVENSKLTFVQTLTREIFWILYSFSSILAVYFSFFYSIQTLLLVVISTSTLQIIFNYKHLSIHDRLAETQVIY